MSLFSNTNTPALGGGLFGQSNQQQQQQQQQQQPAGGGLLGNTQNTGTTQQPGLLFTNPNSSQQPQQSQPSLFSNPSTTGTGGGLFGGASNTNTNTNTNTNANQSTLGGGLFGGQSGGGLFGANTNQQQQPTAGGGLFGNTQGQQQQPTLGSGLFGNANNQQQGGTSGGVPFGNNNQQQQGTQQQGGAAGGLFGTSTNQQWGTTGGGVFGTSNQQQGGTSGGGLFGSTNQQQGGGLGGTNGGGLFGSTNQSSGGGLFGGNKPAGSLFSSTLGGNNQQQPQQQQQQQQQQQGGSLFGNSTQQRPGGLFGGNTSTLGQPAGGLGASTLNVNSLALSRPAAPAQKQEDAQAQFVKLTQKIEALYNAWNPNSPQCQFQYPFYNLVDPNQVNMYGRPPNATSDAVWEKAVKENPDPSCLVPVVANGFDNLRERVEAQSRQAEQHQQKLKDLKTKIEALNTQHAVSTSSRLQRAAGQQAQITQRLLAFIQHLHLLIPAIRSSSIRPEEEHLRGQLEQIEDEVKRGRMKGKLNELWALLGAVNAAKERRGNGGGWEWAVVDEDGLAQLAQILAEQQAGLALLTKILQKDMKDLAVIMGQGSGAQAAEEAHLESEHLWNSTNTLRASALR